MSVSFDDHMLLCSLALMFICSYVHLLWCSHASIFTRFDDRMLWWSHAHLPVCFHAHMLWCFDDYMFLCSNAFLIAYSHALIFTCLISTHMFTHLDDEMSIGFRFKWMCSWMFVRSNALTILLECWGHWEIRGMCTWVLKCLYDFMVS